MSLTKISGLSTILSGNKIEVSLPFDKIENKKEAGKLEAKYEFMGLDTKPNFDLHVKGYYVSILSSRADLVEVETPVFLISFK